MTNTTQQARWFFVKISAFISTRINSVCSPYFLMFIVMSVSLTTYASDPMQGPQRVHGETLRVLISEKELSDGTHFILQFHRDGLLTGTWMAKSQTGRWKITTTQLCLTWQLESQECYDARRLDNYLYLYIGSNWMIGGELSPIP